nr:MAG TPA: hypothetical protein [Caudoviricetes sp.]
MCRKADCKLFVASIFNQFKLATFTFYLMIN